MVETLRLLAPSEPLEEEDEDLEDMGCYCACCDELIGIAEAAILVRTAVGYKTGEGFQCFLAYDDNGDFRHSPIIMHETCWHELLESVDALPLMGADTECGVCQSRIMDGDEFSVVQPVVPQISPRSPMLHPEIDLQEYGCASPICLDCMLILDQYIEEYDSDG